MIFSLIFGALLGAISVIFIIQNVAVVTVTFLNWQFEGSLALILFLTLISGIVMTLLLLLPTFIKDVFYLSSVEKQKKALEEELTKTRGTLADVASGPHGSGAIIVETTPL